MEEITVKKYKVRKKCITRAVHETQDSSYIPSQCTNVQIHACIKGTPHHTTPQHTTHLLYSSLYPFFSLSLSLFCFSHLLSLHCISFEGKMMISRVVLLLVMWIIISGVMGAAPKKAVDVPFGRNYIPTWAFDHIKYSNGGSDIQLMLDNYTGTGFQSKDSYLFGHFSMRIKMVPGDSAGTVTAFYLSSQNSEHDEIDFEFLGNRTGQPYILQTNVFTGGKGDREQRIYLWFDPTKDYHSYSVLWNLYQIVFFVDDVPIRVFKNCKELGVKFPFNQPMKLYSSLWNADDWATRGGLEKTDWSKAPFVASYRGFHIDGCEASVEAKYCATQGKRWWDQKEYQDLDRYQYRRLRWVRTKFTIYNYCKDTARSGKVPPECKRDRDLY